MRAAACRTARDTRDSLLLTSWYGGGLFRLTAQPGSRGVIDMVESVYAGLDEITPARWLARTIGAVHRLSSASVAAYGYGYDLDGPPERWRISRPIVHGMPDELGESIHASFVASPPRVRRGLLRLGASGTLSDTTGLLLSDLPPSGASAARSLGVTDAMHVNASDPNGRGVLLALAIATPTRMPSHERRRFAMIAAHVAAARRLLLSGRAEVSPAAIFERDGKLAHAGSGHDDAFSTLKEHVLRTEGMRDRRQSTDPDEVLASWQALVAGRYTLVGRFDSDGRRYVLAYDNGPSIRDPRGLSALEASVANLARHGHAQKLIAYELGLTVGTVGGIVARVYRKLGVESRAELIDRLMVPTTVARAADADSDGELLLFTLPAGALDAQLALLTRAERDVALAASEGKANDAIARSRGTSVRTVEEQLGVVMRKLDVRSRAELAALLRRERSE